MKFNVMHTKLKKNRFAAITLVRLKYYIFSGFHETVCLHVYLLENKREKRKHIFQFSTALEQIIQL